MRILYAIQGTGNGHISRARDIIPLLQAKGELDLLVSGIQNEIKLPHKVKYNCKGLGFVFGKKGGVDFINTFLKNRSLRFLKEVNSIPVHQYDIILNDFEPVTAWAAHLKKIPCIALSHQSAVLSLKAPQPKHFDPLGSFILKNYAPATKEYGFHFSNFAENIFTPVIRKEIREISTCDKGHYTVYLPSYENAYLLKKLKVFKNIKWEIFSKYCTSTIQQENITIRPIQNETFVYSMATSTGILCGAGFETPAEALFLRKKLLVVPMKNQYEQHCNAAALKSLSVPVIKVLKKKHFDTIQNWIDSTQKIEVDYQDNTSKILDMIIDQNI